MRRTETATSSSAKPMEEEEDVEPDPRNTASQTTSTKEQPSVGPLAPGVMVDDDSDTVPFFAGAAGDRDNEASLPTASSEPLTRLSIGSPDSSPVSQSLLAQPEDDLLAGGDGGSERTDYSTTMPVDNSEIDEGGSTILVQSAATQGHSSAVEREQKPMSGRRFESLLHENACTTGQVDDLRLKSKVQLGRPRQNTSAVDMPQENKNEVDPEDLPVPCIDGGECLFNGGR